MSETGRTVTIYWRPHHEVHPELPPEQDFLAFDEATERSIGRVSLEKHSANVGRWHWSMFAHRTGPVPFETHGHENTRGAAGRRVAETYRQFLEHAARRQQRIRRDPDDPRTCA